MRLQLVKPAVAILTIFTLLGADYGRVECRASCFAATIHAAPKHSCCSHKTSHTCSISRVAPGNDCSEDGPKCASCCESSPAIKHRKAAIPINLNVAYAGLPAITSLPLCCNVIRTDWGRFAVIASLRPSAQVMHCVWRN